MKSDIEVYIGIYLVVVWFLGWSNILTIMMYWQVLRLRYMISSGTQGGFRRVNAKIKDLLSHRMVPGLVRGLYNKISGFLSGMVESEMNAAASGQSGGGLMSKCNIF